MSASTTALLTTIRTRLLDFVPADGGATLGTRLGNRLYETQAPADTLSPYGVYRLMNRIETDGFAGMRETGDVEVMLFTRPRSEAATLDAAADVADQALLSWAQVTDGITFARFRTRDMLPPAPDPWDRELVVVRLVFPVVVWPTYRTQYA
jgi:hypothetical protein